LGIPLSTRRTAVSMAAQGQGAADTSRRGMLKLASATSAGLMIGLGSSTSMEPACAAAPGSTVLVVGATGSIGQATCMELLSKGYKVRGLTRRSADVMKGYAKKNEWIGKVDWVVGDLKKPETLADGVKGVDKIVFAAGAHAWDPNEGGIANNKIIFSDSVKELTTLAAKEGKVDRFVLVSSGGVTHYEDFGESLADCLKWKLDGERILKASGVPYTVVRFYFYANQDSSTEFVQVTQGDPRDRTGGINLENLAIVLSDSLSNPKLKGTTFEIFESTKTGSMDSLENKLASVKPDTGL